VFVQRTGIGAPVDHKRKYKQEVSCGEKMVGDDRVARPGKKTGRSYQISVKPF
jgi:hypothetical protein